MIQTGCDDSQIGCESGARILIWNRVVYRKRCISKVSSVGEDSEPALAISCQSCLLKQVGQTKRREEWSLCAQLIRRQHYYRLR
jgi:hypothetical protein